MLENGLPSGDGSRDEFPDLVFFVVPTVLAFLVTPGAPVEDEAAVSAREAVLGKMEGVRVSFMIMQAFFTDAAPTVWAKVKQHYANKKNELGKVEVPEHLTTLFTRHAAIAA